MTREQHEGDPGRPLCGCAVVTFVPAAACFLITLALGTSRALYQKLFSDEHLFIGGAGLIARGEGLIYRDFFYNHMPTHALVLAGLFKVTGHWLLAGRLLDALCGAVLVTLIFEAVRRGLSAVPRGWAVVLASAVAGLFVFNPITAETIGRAWNHNLAAMSCVLGYLLLVRGLAGAPNGAWRWALASGACAAIAVTSRLTFAPPLAGFVVLMLLAPGRTPVERLRLLVAWSVGGLIAASPAIYVFFQAYEAAFFGNVRFPSYTAIYHAKATTAKRLLFSTKLTYLYNTIAPSVSLLIILAMTIISVAIAFRPRRRTLRQAAYIGVIVMLLAATVGMFMPTPMFRQYLYGPLPFAALAIGWASPAAVTGAWRLPARIGLVIIAAVSVAMSVREYGSIVVYTMQPSTWASLKSHADGQRLARMAGPHAQVLTLAPAIALEGGHSIYRQLSIGRYGLRAAVHMNTKERRMLHLPLMADIRRWFVVKPPDAVLLVNPQSAEEQQLATVAKEYGYVRTYFGKNEVVYLPPTKQRPKKRKRSR